MLFSGDDLTELDEDMGLLGESLERVCFAPAHIGDWLAENHRALVEIEELCGMRLTITFTPVVPELSRGPLVYRLEASWQETV